MEPFTQLSGIAVPLPIDNLDTDQLMPKQFLRSIDKSGLARGLLFNMRCAALRTERLSPTVFSTDRDLNIFRSSLPAPTSAADPAESMLFGASFNSAFGR